MPKLIMLNKERIEHLKDRESYDTIVLRIMGQAGIPLPFNFLRELTGLQKGHLHRILTNLEKHDYIKKSTITTSCFYVIKEDGTK